MRLPDGTILMHEKTPYDPVKAHEYYIRTRELKGRRKGRDPARTLRVGRSSVARSPLFTVTLPSGKDIKLTGQQLAEQRAYAAKRVAEIKNRLTELSTKLRKMKGEVKTKEVKAKREAKKKPTVAERSKAAKESKQYREKHKQSLASKSKRKSGTATKTKSKKDPAAVLDEKITEIKSRLTAAVARQRALASATRDVS